MAAQDGVHPQSLGGCPFPTPVSLGDLGECWESLQMPGRGCTVLFQCLGGPEAGQRVPAPSTPDTCLWPAVECTERCFWRVFLCTPVQWLALASPGGARTTCPGLRRLLSAQAELRLCW